MRAGLAIGGFLGLAGVALVGGCAVVLGFEATTVRPDAPDDSGLADGGENADGSAVTSVLDFTPTSVLVRRGGNVELAVSIRRGLDLPGTVGIRLDDLPAGVTAPAVTIEPSSTSATLTISAAVTATLGSRIAHLRVDAPALRPALDVPLSVADPAGALDVTFDDDGLVSDPSRGVNAVFYAVAVQADAKLVAGGLGDAPAGWIVRRFSDTGAPEPAFAAAGVGLPDDGELRAIALDGSGRILLAGGSSPGAAQPAQLTVVRLLARGAIDASFAGGAFRLGAAEGLLGSSGYAIAVQPDGAIVVAGARREPALFDAGASDLAGIALRLKDDGTRDATFGGGLVVVQQNKFVGLSIAKDGSVVLAGTDSNPSRALPSYSLTRRAGQGQLDATFGAGGTLEFGAGFRANGFARLADGTLGVVGDSVLPGEPRYTAGASASAGAQLWLRGAPAPSAAYFAAAGSKDGRLVAAGHAAEEARVDMLLADGGRDDAFGERGTAFIDPPGPSAFTVSLFAAAVQPDGRLLVAGGRSNAGAAIYRLWP